MWFWPVKEYNYTPYFCDSGPLRSIIILLIFLYLVDLFCNHFLSKISQKKHYHSRQKLMFDTYVPLHHVLGELFFLVAKCYGISGISYSFQVAKHYAQGAWFQDFWCPSKSQTSLWWCLWLICHDSKLDLSGANASLFWQNPLGLLSANATSRWLGISTIWTIQFQMNDVGSP